MRAHAPDGAVDGANDPSAQMLQHRALRHLVHDSVVDALRSGRLRPGTHVHEVSLARSLDVSIAPVREALFRLADQGALEHRPRRGFYVRSFGEKETREIFTFRASLEGLAARLIAERRRSPDPATRARDDVAFREMFTLLEHGHRAAVAGDRAAVGAANGRFHDRLIRAADHTLLERGWALLAPAEWLLVPTWTWAHEPVQPDEAEDWVRRHQQLLDAVVAGDPESAERVAAAHVREAGEENLDLRFGTPTTAAQTEARS